MIHGINDDKAVRFEGAAEILNTMIAQNSREIAEEELKTNPNSARIAKLNDDRQRLTRERRTLDPDDTNSIDHVYADYAPILKRRFAQQQAA